MDRINNQMLINLGEEISAFNEIDNTQGREHNILSIYNKILPDEEIIYKILPFCTDHVSSFGLNIDSIELIKKLFVEVKDNRLKSIAYNTNQVPIEENIQIDKVSTKEKADIDIQDLYKEKEQLTNELAAAHSALKRTNKVKYAKVNYDIYHYSYLQEIADRTRKKNNKLNYHKISSELHIDDKTTKKICNHHQIK